MRVVTLLLAGALVFPAAVDPGESGCPRASQLTGGCSSATGEIRGQGVEVTGQTSTVSRTAAGFSGGSGFSPEQGASGATGGSGGGGTGAPAPIYIPPLGDNGFGDYDIDCVIGAAGHCIDRYIPDLPPAEPADGADAAADEGDGVTVITISDIASFTPRTAVPFMQPDGWTVVGLHTNFYAQIDQHVVAGTLLGQPADVRFTPRAYNWNYGDGATALVGTPGNTWHALGLAEFDPTATSHVYANEGTYEITLTVLYTAEYRWAGGPWTAIAGHVELPASPLVARAASDAVTVLVDRACTRGPAGPGC